MVLNQHTCRLTRLWASSHACKLHPTSNIVCYNCTQLTGMLGTVALDQRAYLFKLHPSVCMSVPGCLFYFLPTSSTGIIATGSADIPLRMFDYVALDQHTCLKPSSYVCNSLTRLAGMLQYPGFKRCFEQTGIFVAVASNHLARPLQLNSTSMHVLELHLPADMFESVATDYKHICSCVA